MNRLAMITAVAAALVFTTASAVTFTQTAGGPQTPGTGRLLLQNDGDIYTTVSDGIFKSANGGQAWTRLPATMPGVPQSLALAGSSLFIATPRGLFRSGDDGATWTDFNGSGSGAFPLTGFINLIGGSNVIYAFATDSNFNSRLYRSAEAAPAWTEVTPPGVTSIGGGVVTSTGRLCLLAGNSGVRMSTDNGATWVNPGLNGQFAALATSPADANRVYAANFSGGIQRSTNGCQSFGSAGFAYSDINGVTVRALGVDAGGNVYISGDNGGVQRAGNDSAGSGSISFATVAGGSLPAGVMFSAGSFVPTGGGILAAVGGSGTHFRTTGDWSARNAGLVGAQVAVLADVGGADDFMLSHGGGVLVSLDGGATYLEKNNGLTNRGVGAVANIGDLFVASVFTPGNGTQPPGAYRSTDGGDTWTQLQPSSGLAAGKQIDALVTDGTAFYAALSFSGGLWRSTDGATWTQLAGTGLPSATPSVRNLAVRGSTLFVYVGNSGVFRSIDSGATWTATDNAALSGNKFGKVFTWSGGVIASAGGVVYRSANDGTTWTPTTGHAISRFGIEILSLGEDAGGNLYLGDEHAGLSISKDGGATWTPDSDGLHQSSTCIGRIHGVLFKNGKLYAGQGEGGGVLVADPIGSAVPGDSIPCTTDTDIFANNFNFTAQNNVAPSTAVTSNSITVLGLGAGVSVPVTVSGGEYSIGCSSFTSLAGTVSNNDSLCVRHTSAAVSETLVRTTLTIGNPAANAATSATFTSATGLVFTGRDDEINTGFGNNGFASASNVAQADDLKILADGRILTGGITQGFDPTNGSGFVAVMYTAAGALDPSFGTGGKVTVQPTTGSDNLVSVIPLPNGKFMLVGYSIGSGAQITLVRLNANGSLDTDFDTDGILFFDIHPNTVTNRSEIVGDAVLLANGSILVAGQITTDSQGRQVFAVKFSQDGVADTAFGADSSLFRDGVASSGSVDASSVGGLVVQSTGKFVVAGTGATTAIAVRFNADGTVDPTWGVSGLRSIPPGFQANDAVLGGGDKVLLFGQTTSAAGSRAYVARLNADGTLDNGFAGDGVFTLDTVNVGRFNSGELLASGDIAAIGSGTGPDGSAQFLHLRLNSDGTPDSGFGPGGQGYVFRGPVNGNSVTGTASGLRADGGVVVGGVFGSNQGVFVYGGGSGSQPDTTPNAYSFAAQTGVEPMAEVTSASATIGGINAAAPVTVSGGSYSIGCTTSFSTAAGSISDGQTVCVRHTAAMAFSTDTVTTLSIGGVQATFTSTTRAGNTTPNDFEFADASNVAPSTVVISSAVAISGNEAPAAVSVQNGEYAIGCSRGVFTAEAGSISAGQVICVRHTSAATPGGMVNTTLTVGGKSDVFTSTVAQTPPPDTTPNSFSFTDVSNAALSTEQISNPVTVNGINAAAAISVTGGEYRIGSGAFTAASGTVAQGDSVTVRHTSAATAGTAVNTTLTIGGVMDTFTSTTAAAQGSDTTPDAFSFADRSGVVPNSQITSNSITVGGINAPAAISITGGQYRIGNGNFTSQAGTVNNGDNVSLRVTSGAAGATVNVTLSIGGVSDIFSVTSAAQSGGGTVNDPQGRPVSLATTLGTINNFQSIPTPVGAISIQGAQYPNGFFSYNVTGLPNGGTAQVSFTLPAAGANAYVKCDSSGNCVRIPDASITINGRTMTISMLDGGPFDEDGVANGTIVDPGAPAIISSETTVESGGGSFGAGAMLLALAALRRRRAALGLLALCAALPAAADGGWYAGLRGGSARSHLDSAQLSAELQARGHNVTAVVDDSVSGGTLYLGYRLQPAAAVELGLMHAGQFDTRITGAPANVQAMADDAAHLLGGSGNAISAALRFDFPIAGALDFSPRFGAYVWKTDIAVSGGASAEGSEKGLGGLIGLGLSLRLPGGLRAGLGYELLRSTTHHSIEQIQAQLEFHWGS